MLLQNSTYLQVLILMFSFRRQIFPEWHDQKKIKVLNPPELEKERWIIHYFVLEITYKNNGNILSCSILIQ